MGGGSRGEKARERSTGELSYSGSGWLGFKIYSATETFSNSSVTSP